MRSSYSSAAHHPVTEPVRCNGPDDPELARRLPKAALAKLREEIEMARDCARRPTRGLIAKAI